MNRPQTVSDTVDIKVNLFDYDKNYLLDPADNDNLASNDYDSYKSISTNSMANGSMFWFLSSGSGTEKSWNNYTKGAVNKGIVKNALGTDGFPALAGSGQNSQSLKYLFDTSKTYWNGGSQDGMIAYPNVNGMFQKDSDGYYYYNSNTNYFYYNSGTKETKLYEHTYTQTSSEGQCSDGEYSQCRWQFLYSGCGKLEGCRAEPAILLLRHCGKKVLYLPVQG